MLSPLLDGPKNFVLGLRCKGPNVRIWPQAIIPTSNTQRPYQPCRRHAASLAHLPAILSERPHTRERSPSVVCRIVSGISSQNCVAHCKPNNALRVPNPKQSPPAEMRWSSQPNTARHRINRRRNNGGCLQRITPNKNIRP